MNPDDVINASLDQILVIFDLPCGELYLYNPMAKLLVLSAQRGLSPAFVETGLLHLGEGLAGFAAQQSSVFIETPDQDERLADSKYQNEGLRCYAGLPLVFEDQLIGVLGMYGKSERSFPDNQRKLLAELTKRVSLALHHALEFNVATQRTRRNLAISQAISTTRQLETEENVFQNITRVLVQSLGFDLSWIGIIKDNMLKGHSGFGAGITPEIINRSFRLDAEQSSPAVCVIQRKKPVVYQFIEDLDISSSTEWMKRLGVQSLAYVPILDAEDILGCIGVFNTSDQTFQEEDIKALISVAEQTSIAIENARLYERIRHSEERYRVLFNSAGSSLVIVDSEMEIRLVNAAFEALSGYFRDELVGKMKLSDFISKDDQETFQKPLVSEDPREIQFTGKNGLIKQVHYTAEPIEGADQQLVSLMDVTRQRELERRLFRSEELAAIGELSAGIAHEIRNPLVAISTSVSLLRDEPDLSQEGRQLLDVVKEESDHLAVIVDDFLKYARPKKPNFESIHINQLLADVLKRYRDWNESDIQWKERYDENVQEIFLDKHQMQQVITNLITNGLSAMKSPGVISVETLGEMRLGEPWVIIRVSDTGEGIPEKELSKIFQPFYSNKERGTGMGLAICRRIIHDHDGEILVESETDKGTTFTIQLPAQRNKDRN